MVEWKEMAPDGSFGTKHWLSFWKYSGHEAGEYRFVILNLPFVRLYRKTEFLQAYRFCKGRRWVYPFWMWSKEPGKPWRMMKTQWALCST